MSDCATMDGIYHLLALSLYKSFHIPGSMDGQDRSWVKIPPYIGNGKMCIASISSIQKRKGHRQSGNLYQYYIPYIGVNYLFYRCENT